ncbi:hypothetical protein GCM10008935_19900 [Alkalibacillus silvisoli]|uniref:IstB-like ATP-binding domain-containing protein n=1 Tax=Alkalibacillus silvisoli TaxID=392823 RepID=A0ABP3JTT8_9BACI
MVSVKNLATAFGIEAIIQGYQVMFMAMDQREANLLFHLINDLHDKASIILTSNKGPSEWGELLGDQGITIAILDRVLHRVEVNQFRDG